MTPAAEKEMREALVLLDGRAALKRAQQQQQQETGMLQVCMECCGTILPHSTGGAERGTCHCARGPGRIKAMLFYGGDPRKYGVEWEGEVIAVHPPTLLRAVVVLYDLRAEWIALHESELPRGSVRGNHETFGRIMAIWERLHAPFLAAADMQVDPIRKIEHYRRVIQVDYACELAHQRLAETARRMKL